jgi:hypothetical protein
LAGEPGPDWAIRGGGTSVILLLLLNYFF